MTEHPATERISALLDEPWADIEAQTHLERCRPCQAEFERLSRMRMALSALGDLDPPAGQWAAIDAALDEARAGGPAGRSPAVGSPMRLRHRFLTSGTWQAAAGVTLFAGGVLAGLQLTGGGFAAGPAGTTAGVPAVVASSGEDRALLDGLAQLEQLRAPLRQVGSGEAPAGRDLRPGAAAGVVDPLETQRQMARLEGLIRAMREGLERSPGDAVASAYLLALMDERGRLAEELERSFFAARTVEW